MKIVSLKINGREIGEEGYAACTGERLRLSWKCDGCDACIVYPYGWEGGPEGSAEIFVYQPMTLLLRAYNQKESVQREAFVAVKGGECLKGVSAQPSGPVRAGEENTFCFDEENTNYGYLDHGIGRVEGDSYSQCLRDNYSPYRYCILSRSSGRTDYQEKSVKAGRNDALSLDRLKYILMRENGGQLYRLEWRVANCGEEKVFIKISDSSEETAYEPSGKIVFQREGGEVRTVSIRCRTQTGEEIYFSSIYPYDMK